MCVSAFCVSCVPACLCMHGAPVRTGRGSVCVCVAARRASSNIYLVVVMMEAKSCYVSVCRYCWWWW